MTVVAIFPSVPKLPTTKKTAELMIQAVFRLHSLPREVMLDRGPRFSGGFWILLYTAINTLLPIK